MKLLRRSNVPTFLQQGGFFKSLSEDDDEIAFEVPVHCFKADPNVNSNAELENLLHTMQFWLCVDDEACMIAVMEYVFSVPLTDELCDLLIPFEASMPFITDTKNTSDILVVACKYGFYELVKKSIGEVVGGYDVSAVTVQGAAMEAAVKHDKLNIVTLLLDSGVTNIANACFAAVETGHLECMKAMIIHCNKKDIRCHMRGDVVNYAAGKGQVAILKFLHERGFVWGVSTTSAAVTGGYLDCLKFLHESGCAWDQTTTGEAVKQGHLPCLQYALDNGCAKNQYTHSTAAYYGHLDCLQYLLDKYSEVPTDLCNVAAGTGHIDCLQLAHSRGCAWGIATCNEAATQGQLACLQFLHENGCPWDASTCEKTIYFDKVECLQYAYENGCPWNERIVSFAAERGKMRCLKYMHGQGVSLTVDALNKAVGSGQLACVEFLLAHGCERDATTCVAAAAEGRIDCLVKLHESGCPWDANTIREATKKRHAACVLYAKSNGCEEPPEYANIDGRGLHAEHYAGTYDVLRFEGQMPDFDLIPRSANFNCRILYTGKPLIPSLSATRSLAKGDPLVLELILPAAPKKSKKAV